MADVFISYKREERGLVEKLAGALRGLGLTVWFDASLSAGETFSDQIDREAREAQTILVCWSPNAKDSRWVKAEALIGIERNVLAACYVAGPDGFSPQVPFNGTHTEDLRDWLEGGTATDARWRSLLRRIGTLTNRADIESFGDISESSDIISLGRWLDTHKNSPLFLVVENIYRARLAEEEARESREREAKARFEAEQAQRLAREEAAQREAERLRLEEEAKKRLEAEAALKKAEEARKVEKARADRAEAEARKHRATANLSAEEYTRLEYPNPFSQFAKIVLGNCIKALPASTFFSGFAAAAYFGFQGRSFSDGDLAHLKLIYELYKLNGVFPGGGRGWFAGVNNTEWISILIVCQIIFFLVAVGPLILVRKYFSNLAASFFMALAAAALFGFIAFLVCIVLPEGFASFILVIAMLGFVFGGLYVCLRSLVTGEFDEMPGSPAYIRWHAVSWLLAFPFGFVVLQALGVLL